MKNPLELELQLKIKRANRFLAAKQYPEAIKEYSEGLDLYQQNRTYNNSVSQQFEAILYSLRGNTYSLDFNSQSAEEDFRKSLNINPYSALTLNRRAKHFMKEKRFSQAIQDIDLALLYDPQNLSYLSLLNSIQNYANEIKDEQQRKHISSLVTDVKNRLQAKPPTQSESQEEDSQQILNFSKLKQIDRKSIRLTPKMQNRKSIIEFKQDEILEYIKDDDMKENTKESELFNIRISSVQIQEKIKEQDQQLDELEAEEQEIRKTEPIKLSEHFVLTKTHERSRKSILRSSIHNKADNMLFISSPGEKSSFLRKSSLCAASIKDIDGKIVKHQSDKIKFRPSFSQVARFDLGRQEQIPEENEKQNFLTRTTPKLQKRKSCLRNSNRFLMDDLEHLSKTAPLQKKSSGFLTIKNIDGDYHTKKAQSSQSDEGAVDVKIQTESDDDDEHNIFGIKKQKEAVDKIDNVEDIPETMTMKLSKKKSILRKDSLIDGSMLGSMLGWKGQKKKSVLFKTG